MGALAGTVHGSVLRRREPGQCGDSIDASRAGRITQVARPALRFAQVHTAGFYDDAGFCQDYDVPSCCQHWHVSESGYGYCLCGHGKSLDPHC